MPAAASPTAPARTLPLYIGGFLGPFGGAMVAPMLPELRDGLDTTLAVAAANLTVYLIPFAGFMVVSGSLAERWGRRRTVRTAYVGYALASLVCALAPAAPWFLAGRALQGVANAFTTPILLAALSDLAGPQRLGRTLGLFGSVQAAGLTFAPVVGGLAAAVDWRLAFWITMLTALGLATQPPADAARRPGNVQWRALVNPRLALACATAALAYLTTVGITTLSALLAGDRFGLPPGARGVVVATFGVAGLLAGGVAGRQLDRRGVRRFGVVGYLSLAGGAVLAAVSPSLLVLVAALALSGVAGLASRVTVNSLAVLSTPGNRGGAASVMLAAQFLGGALALPLLIPVYRVDPTWALVAAAGSCLLAAAVLALAPVRWLSPARV